MRQLPCSSMSSCRRMTSRYVPCLSFKGIDIALFSAGGSISKKLGPVAAAAGSIVSVGP